jgi:hypothetical protein
MNSKIVEIRETNGIFCLVNLNYPVDSKLFEYLCLQDYIKPFTSQYLINKNLEVSNLILEIPTNKVADLEKLILDFHSSSL